MNALMNKPNRRWIDAVAVILTASMGAAALNSIQHNKTPAVASMPQPAQGRASSLTAERYVSARSFLPPPDQIVQHTNKVIVVTPCVKAALLSDETLYPSTNPSVNCINVDADSEGKTIVLKGAVQTASMKKLAEKITRNVPAAASFKIDNQLTIAKH